MTDCALLGDAQLVLQALVQEVQQRLGAGKTLIRTGTVRTA